MDKNTRDILDALDFIKERMATKDDLKNYATKDDVREIVRAMIVEVVPGIVAVEIKPVREQLRQIEKRLEALEQNYANLKGVTKEIDEIRGEVRAIQKHLGIERKIAA
jgi:septation ring formation regulator EzrA